MTQGVTQVLARASATRSRYLRRRRPPGPYLELRGRTYYYRRRLCAPAATACGRQFLCLSLRTDLLREAMRRAVRLLAAQDEAERQIMSDVATKGLTEAEGRVILAEMLRGALREVFTEQATLPCPTDQQIDVRINELNVEIDALRRQARRGDFQAVERALREAALTASVTLPQRIDANLGRKAMDLAREVRTAQLQIEDGEEAVQVVSPLVATYSAAPVSAFLEGAVTVSQVTEQTYALHPTASMRATIAATDELVRDRFGDIDFGLITEEGLMAWMTWLLRLPKLHGKKHGKNRYTSEGRTRSKQAEMDEADLLDEFATEEVRAMEGLSVAQKRATLARTLKPRMTTATVRKHRNNFARMLRAAQSLGVRSAVKVPSYKDIDACVAKLAESRGELYVRVTKPKVRTPWSEEHLARLLTSPVYTGCATPHRRWKPGPLVIRDATYWVPLLVMFLGSRIEEVLRLKKGSLRRRNGVDCLAIGFGADER